MTATRTLTRWPLPPARYAAQRSTGPCDLTDWAALGRGLDYWTSFRQAAPYVDRILRGASPSDLLIEVPTKYETVLNANLFL
jgi:hypothetical protein